MNEGAVEHEGRIALNLQPGRSEVYTLSDGELGSGDLYLDLRIEQPMATAWSSAGHVVATEQFVLQQRDEELPGILAPAAFSETEEQIKVSAKGASGSSVSAQASSSSGPLTAMINWPRL